MKTILKTTRPVCLSLTLLAATGCAIQFVTNPEVPGNAKNYTSSPVTDQRTIFSLDGLRADKEAKQSAGTKPIPNFIKIASAPNAPVNLIGITGLTIFTDYLKVDIYEENGISSAWCGIKNVDNETLEANPRTDVIALPGEAYFVDADASSISLQIKPAPFSGANVHIINKLPDEKSQKYVSLDYACSPFTKEASIYDGDHMAGNFSFPLNQCELAGKITSPEPPKTSIPESYHQNICTPVFKVYSENPDSRKAFKPSADTLDSVAIRILVKTARTIDGHFHPSF